MKTTGKSGKHGKTALAEERLRKLGIKRTDIRFALDNGVTFEEMRRFLGLKSRSGVFTYVNAEIAR